MNPSDTPSAQSRNQKLRQAREVFEEGQYAQAAQLLEPLWAQAPFDREVFYLLNDCYQELEKWDSAEKLIRQLGEAYGETPHEHLLRLYLARKDVLPALQSAIAVIAENPDDQEGISQIGYAFKSAGYETEYLAQLESLSIPGFDAQLALARYYADVKQDYPAAINRLNELLKRRPADEILPGLKKFYHQLLFHQKKTEAANVLAGAAAGDAVALCREVLALEPENVTAREYYLSALACRIFPPFKLYFHQNNLVGRAPMFIRAILLVIFCLIGALYYKGGVAPGAYDQLKTVTWFLAAIAIPRYTLFPLSVQMLSFRYVPGYHLLQRPYDFLKGLILLSSWTALVVISVDPAKNGFQHFLCGSFVITYVGLLEWSGQLGSGWQRKLLRAYTLLTLAMSALVCLKILPDGFLFLVIGGWLPPMLIGVALEFIEKMQSPLPQKEGNTQAQLTQTRRIHQIALVAAILLTVLFFFTIKKENDFSDWVKCLAFGGMMYGYTLFSFTDPAEKGLSFSAIWAQKPAFRRIFILCSLLMLGGILALTPYMNVPIRSTWAWAPAISSFLLGWAGLFVTMRMRNSE